LASTLALIVHPYVRSVVGAVAALDFTRAIADSHDHVETIVSDWAIISLFPPMMSQWNGPLELRRISKRMPRSSLSARS
jgi:hypothetical protein